MGNQANIRVYQTVEHACGYWPDRNARDLVLDPVDPTLPTLYGSALAMGFRRSGNHVYRPHCAGCQACTPVRIPTGRFQPNRAQRRCLSRNADLQVDEARAVRTDENFELYRRYVSGRHAGGGMDDPSPADFEGFLACDWSPTRFLEIRNDKQLVAVAVTDVLADSLSAVYTFFDPELAARSLGTFAILSQIQHARQAGLDYLYLGFWLRDHPKMDYKQRFRPLQYLSGRDWLPFLTPPG
ncbi:MAG: arginyltransferase [Frankiaceae bacterium]|nr:arginyltransferase [Arenimonas sp.]